MAPIVIPEITAALIRFFQARLLDPDRKISGRSNVKRLCGYEDDASGWRKLARSINALPPIRKAGMKLRPTQMNNCSTIVELQREIQRSAAPPTPTAKDTSAGKRTGMRKGSHLKARYTASRGPGGAGSSRGGRHRAHSTWGKKAPGKKTVAKKRAAKKAAKAPAKKAVAKWPIAAKPTASAPKPVAPKPAGVPPASSAPTTASPSPSKKQDNAKYLVWYGTPYDQDPG
jgi:hypothetical protein